MLWIALNIEEQERSKDTRVSVCQKKCPDLKCNQWV